MTDADAEFSPLQGRDIMVSYARADQSTLANDVYELLLRRGANPFKDDREIKAGVEWQPVLTGWLETCEAAVLFISKAALDSPWVRHELSVLAHRRAVEREDRAPNPVMLVPLLMGDVEIADLNDRKNAPFALGDLNILPIAPDGGDPAGWIVGQMEARFAVGGAPSTLRQRNIAGIISDGLNRDNAVQLANQLEAALEALVGPGAGTGRAGGNGVDRIALEMCRTRNLPRVVRAIDDLDQLWTSDANAFLAFRAAVSSMFETRVCESIWQPRLAAREYGESPAASDGSPAPPAVAVGVSLSDAALIHLAVDGALCLRDRAAFRRKGGDARASIELPATHSTDLSNELDAIRNTIRRELSRNSVRQVDGNQKSRHQRATSATSATTDVTMKHLRAEQQAGEVAVTVAALGPFFEDEQCLRRALEEHPGAMFVVASDKPVHAENCARLGVPYLTSPAASQYGPIASTAAQIRTHGSRLAGLFQVSYPGLYELEDDDDLVEV